MSPRNLWLVLLLLLLPLPLSAQRSGDDDGNRARDRGPVEMLLRQRSELGLSDEQVARLRVVEQRMEEKNAPLIAELVRIRRELHGERQRKEERSDEQRREVRRRMAAARPLMKQIRENNRAAMREVGGILTAPQKARLRELLRERRDRHDDDDDRRRSRGRRG